MRATLLAFFALIYAATLISHAITIGIPGPSWRTAGTLVPFAFLGGFVGRPIGDRPRREGLHPISRHFARGGLALHHRRRRHRFDASAPIDIMLRQIRPVQSCRGVVTQSLKIDIIRHHMRRPAAVLFG